MKKPLALNVISILFMVISIFRILIGTIAFSISNPSLLNAMNQSISNNLLGLNSFQVILIENFIFGVLFFISGILLFLGKRFGRLVFIILAVCTIMYSLSMYSVFNIIVTIIFLLCLYLIPSIKEYFSSNPTK